MHAITPACPAVLLAAAAAAASPQVYAQGTPPTLLPEVTVSATRVEHDSFDLPVSIDRVDRRQEILEDTPRAEVDLGVDLHAGHETQRDKGQLALPP
jgi:outer membrane receptor protein involved in Fe transport